MKSTIWRFQILFLLSIGMAFSAQAGNYPIAGVKPYQRPEAAPVIQQVQKGKNWYAQALHGTTPPYPESFKFLEHQGNWHTPFNRPGMTGYYDIRGWHSGGTK